MISIEERSHDTQEEAKRFFFEHLEELLNAFPKQDFNMVALESGKFVVAAEEEMFPITE